MARVRRWNSDKPHRCPECHAIVDSDKPPTWRAAYECCACGVRFARWPRLAALLPVRTCKDLAPGTCPYLALTRDGGAS
ncbi:hypothetical protein [Actinomadura sediminis]|uniref:Transposase n=1 Tax=Actinomadura sediminis TaxID=1038904 RepID=A0ABW3ERE7_9ACTN